MTKTVDEDGTMRCWCNSSTEEVCELGVHLPAVESVCLSSLKHALAVETSQQLGDNTVSVAREYL